MVPSTHKPKIWLVCTGLGSTNRGFESFFRECFDSLKSEPTLDIKLFKGSGNKASGERALWNLNRNTRLAKILGWFIGNKPYVIEQLTFLPSLFLELLSAPPDLIFFSDKQIGNFLWYFRSCARLKYRLLLSNGAPQTPPYSRADHVQQLTPYQLEIATAAGMAAERQTLLPYGLAMSPSWDPITSDVKIELRRALNLPLNRKIVISVGWINEGHKRMGYLLKEIASISGEPSFLVILGQHDAQSEPILEMAAKLLGPDNCFIGMVPRPQVASYLQAADLFVLASRGEGFGRVYLEAVIEGLPCVAHDFAVVRYLLGKEVIVGNLNIDGRLAELVHQALLLEDPDDAKRLRRADIYRRFSWDSLRASYIEMFRKIITRQSG